LRSFVGDLEAMAGWLAAEGDTEVAMEATASYWKPVWYVREDRAFDVNWVDAHHLKIVRGRKSDVLGRGVDRRTARAWSAARQLRCHPGRFVSWET